MNLGGQALQLAIDIVIRPSIGSLRAKAHCSC